MITYRPFWGMIKKRAISQYDLEKRYGFSHYLLDRLRNNKTIKTETINFICSTLKCNIEDVLEYSEDK